MSDFAAARGKLMALNLGAKRTEFLEEPEHKYSDLPWGEFNKYAVDHVVSKKDFLKAFDDLVTIQFGVKAIMDKAVPLIGGVAVEYLDLPFMEGKEEVVGKAIVEGVWSKRTRIIKPFAELVFRIFDQDQSDTIDKSEYAAAMLMIKAAVNAMEKSIMKRSDFDEVTEEFRANAKSEKKKMMKAVFDAIDVDGNGTLDANEICSLVLEVIGVVINALKVTVKVVVETAASGLIVDLIEDSLSSFPISVDDAIEALAPMMKELSEDPPPDDFVELVSQLLDDFRKHTGGDTTSLSVGRVGGLFAKTLRPFFLESIDEMISDSLLEEVLEEIPIVGDALVERVEAIKTKVKQFVEMGGLTSICTAALDFIDLNSDGELSENELKPLLDGFVKKDWKGFLKALLKVMDADGSGTIDMDDIPVLSKKVVTFGTAVANTFFDFAKTTFSSMVYDIVPPVMAMMDMADGLTKEFLEEGLDDDDEEDSSEEEA